MLTATAVFADIVAATKSTPSTASSAGSWLFLVVLLGLGFIFFRSRSQAARRQRGTLMELSPGDEVLTAAGIFGTVLDVEADRVTLETAPGTRLTVVRSTIARRITEPDGNSVAEQNLHDEGHDGVATAAGWHDPKEDDAAEDGATGAPTETDDKPEADGAPGAGQGGPR